MTSDRSPIHVQDAVYRLQLELLGGIRHQEQLSAAGTLISRSEYEDVVMERFISNLCGYPLCPNSLPSYPYSEKRRYKISRRDGEVLDLRETRMYCSSSCVAFSKEFAASLMDDRCDVLDASKILEVFQLFAKLSSTDQDEKWDGWKKESSVLKITEKENVKKASMEDWIGSSNAIEGYVPRRDRYSVPLHGKFQEKGAKSEESGCRKMDEISSRNKPDFMSTIIVGDQTTNSESVECSNRNGSNSITNKAIRENDSLENIGTTAVAKQNDRKLKSALKSSGVRSNCSVTWADEKNVESMNAGSHCNIQHADKVDSANLSYSQQVESSDSAESLCISSVEGYESSIRCTSAKACAAALSQAAEAVASGESDAVDAAMEAGVVILPCPTEIADRKSSEFCDDEVSSAYIYEDSEQGQSSVKWPRKPVLLDTDLFDTDDSWHDNPPEGFNLTLSPFATMWMPLFGWISASSLAYIYGKNESMQEDFLFVNGREYPRKIVLSDGRSSEIKQTLSGFIARSLPSLVTAVRLPTPVSILEQFLARLLETMSFVDPLPPFRMKQWQVIVLLFIDALSVCRIPSLSQYMGSKRILLHKVVDAASVSSEEYEAMKDFLIPLGRQPEFSSQCGG